MIEDATYLATIEAHKKEILDLITVFNQKVNGVTAKDELTQFRLDLNSQLTELLRQQTRALKFMRGEYVEPETHFAEAVLVGTLVGDL